MDAEHHWQQVYEEREPDQVSWFEVVPERSLALIGAAGLSKDAGVVDIGGGTSSLARELLQAGYDDITVLDLSVKAIERARADAGARATEIDWVAADVREHDFGRRFDLWHDRAVFHFMVESSDRRAYLGALERALRPGGRLVIAAFGPEGPTRCSGLPVQRYGADDLSALLGAEFEREDDELVDHETPSGNRQQFLYARFRRKAQPPSS